VVGAVGDGVEGNDFRGARGVGVIEEVELDAGCAAREETEIDAALDARRAEWKGSAVRTRWIHRFSPMLRVQFETLSLDAV